jgi:malonyl CoA-acyl carrier protein transacylase
MSKVKTLRELQDEVRRLEAEIKVAEEAERRAKDCKVCGEPEHCPCFVDVHEAAAATAERKRIAEWVRLNADSAYLQQDTFGSVSLDSFALADAIEALTEGEQ